MTMAVLTHWNTASWLSIMTIPQGLLNQMSPTVSISFIIDSILFFSNGGSPTNDVTYLVNINKGSGGGGGGDSGICICFFLFLLQQMTIEKIKTRNMTSFMNQTFSDSVSLNNFTQNPSTLLINLLFPLEFRLAHVIV